MISRSSNRVQAIKSKFENLNSETEGLLNRHKAPKASAEQLNKQKQVSNSLFHRNEFANAPTYSDKENSSQNTDISVEGEKKSSEFDSDTNDVDLRPNNSYLHSRSEFRKTLTRQSSDPGKKLHRSHAFRCDRTQKVSPSPKRHDSCKAPSEFTEPLKTGEKRLSRDRLRKLGHVLGEHMKRDNFTVNKEEVSSLEVDTTEMAMPYCSIPDQDVPQHILDQYAQVLKNKKKLDSPTDNRQDGMSDSGVSSETENIDDDKCRLLKKVIESESNSIEEQAQPLISNLSLLGSEISASCRTLKLEKKNPHIILTDTLKKALKQPLPPGPPPKKPPRTFATSPIAEMSETQQTSPKRNTKTMLAKLEKVLQQREAKNLSPTIEPEPDTSPRPQEFHYLCTNILDLNHQTLPNPNNSSDVLKKCFDTFSCVGKHQSTISLPYSKLLEQSNSRKSLNRNSFSSEDLDVETKPILSTFRPESKISLVEEPVYEVPFRNVNRDSVYGVVKCSSVENLLQSKEDLRCSTSLLDQKIYDIPCDSSAPTTPEPESEIITKPKFEFEKLRSSFEAADHPKPEPNTKPADAKWSPNAKSNLDAKWSNAKPNLDAKWSNAKPNLDAKRARSTENLNEDFRSAKKLIEKRFATESKRYKKHERNASAMSVTVAKKERKEQLDMDRENLNRLMSEIYDTVTAACKMDEQKPSKFPTESDAASEDSNKLTRSLTEKRKKYVRRISSRAAYLDPKSRTKYRHQTSVCSYKSETLENTNTYPTFRSWKSFRTSQCNVNKMADADKMADSKVNLTDSLGDLVVNEVDSSVGDLSLDDKAGCLDLDLPFEPRLKGLFDVCLLVGLNYMTGQAYVKSVFPSQVKVPPHIENLIFPETMSQDSTEDTKVDYEKSCEQTQTYSLVLTDEKGERNYGYCRRVLPEGATVCLPLCYCIIGRFRAPGFYYKVLKEIESHHGSSEVEINSILQQLFETDFPSPGEKISLTYHQPQENLRDSINLEIFEPQPDLACDNNNSAKYNSASEKYNSASEKYNSASEKYNSASEKYNSASEKCFKVKVLSRPLEPRVDENCMGVLLDSFGAGLLIKVFGSLLLERKVVIISDNLSQLSACMEGLQSILYPLVWQQPLIACIPGSLQRDILDAPLPILAGCLPTHATRSSAHREGMLIDISNQTAKVLFYHGDESSILPALSYKTLKTTLQMETSRSCSKSDHSDERARNVMISEAFLRFFVEVLDGFWAHFAVGELGEGMGKGDVVFQKDAFIKSASSKQRQYFLEWFAETAMFNHFIQNMAVCYRTREQMAPQPTDYSQIEGIVDAPLPNFYELFDERLTRNCKRSKSLESGGKNNYKNAVNKKVKLLKSKLMDLVT